MTPYSSGLLLIRSDLSDAGHSVGGYELEVTLADAKPVEDPEKAHEERVEERRRLRLEQERRRVEAGGMAAAAKLLPGDVIFEIDEHMGCAMSGLTADARTLIDHARVEAQGHWFTYNERMPVESNVHSIADLALDFADNKGKKRVMSRPFGVALLVGGYDPTDGPVLFNTDPSGTFTKYMAASIGSAQEGSTNLLQEQYNKDMTLKEAETLALTTLRSVMEEKLSSINIEVATIPASTKKFALYTKEELEEVIKQLPAPTLPTLQSAAASAS